MDPSPPYPMNVQSQTPDPNGCHPAQCLMEGNNPPAYPGAKSAYPPQPTGAAMFVPAPTVAVPVTQVVGPSVVLVNNISNQQFRTNNPVMTTCPHCGQAVLTEVRGVVSTLTWLIAGGLCILGCWLCCWIPFVVDSCKDIQHSCPSCRSNLYTYNKV